MTDAAFNKVEHRLSSLIDWIDTGLIALPELQRPYVWSKLAAKELLDSMYRGFPIGHFLFWKNSVVTEARFIGTERRQRSPELLVIDGQQRLTSLYSIMSGKPIVGPDLTPQHIEIAFNPIEERFAVSDASVKNNPIFLPNISPLWTHGSALFDLSERYIDALREVRILTTEEQKKIKASLVKLQSIKDYSITARQLLPSLRDEEVSEIFLRINSQGQPLTAADFIRTLMSVSWSEGRAQIDDFTRRARNNFARSIIEPNADQILRASVSLAFRKPQLNAVYDILRGKDLKTGQNLPQQRAAQFQALKVAQQKVLDELHWHAFQNCTALAGYRNRSQVTSEITVIFVYVLYLIGRTEYEVPEFELRRAIARFFFVCMLTGRYDKSETRMESDLTQFGRTKRSAGLFPNHYQQAVRLRRSRHLVWPAQYTIGSPYSQHDYAGLSGGSGRAGSQGPLFQLHRRRIYRSRLPDPKAYTGSLRAVSQRLSEIPGN